MDFKAGERVKFVKGYAKMQEHIISVPAGTWGTVSDTSYPGYIIIRVCINGKNLVVPVYQSFIELNGLEKYQAATTKSPKSCTCSVHVLFRLGCQCGVHED